MNEVARSNMNSPHELRTDRLLLRRWLASDRRPFADLNADSKVMEHFPRVLTSAESDDLVDGIEQHFTRVQIFIFFRINNLQGFD